MPATATTNEVRITEYCSAAALMAAGARLVKAEGGGRRVVLVYDDSDGEASRLLQAHRTGSLSLPTLQFAHALSEVKNQIFAQRD